MKPLLKDRRGQLMIEAILLMVLLVGLLTVITRYLRDNNTIPNLVSEPWGQIAGMTEFGNWEPPNNSNKKKHPNTFNRFFTPK